MKHYEFEVIGKDQFKVIKIDDKYPKGDRMRYTEYLVNLKGGDMLCDCPGFYFNKRACKHIKFILEQLKDKGGILRFET